VRVKRTRHLARTLHRPHDWREQRLGHLYLGLFPPHPVSPKRRSHERRPGVMTMRFARSCRHSLTRDPIVPTPKTTPKTTPTSTRNATQHTWGVRMHRCAQRARARDRSRRCGHVVVSELLNLRANARCCWNNPISIGIKLRDAARSRRAWAARREKQNMRCVLTVCVSRSCA